MTAKTCEPYTRSIKLDLIDPDPNQPRKTFDAAELKDLAASIEREGLIQPITVRPSSGEHLPRNRKACRFTIIAGERRWRAHKLLNATDIRAQVVEGKNATDIAIAQIIENNQRADVRPLDEARKFKELIDDGVSIESLAERLGRQAFRIEERLRLLDLEPSLLKLYEGGHLSQEAASEISRVKEHAQQTKLVQMVARGQLVGFRAIRTAVDTVLGEKTQADIFGENAPRASEEDVRTISRMEKKIESVVAMVAHGWRNGECVVATKVSPDRARLMADQLLALRRSIQIMESELRSAAAQAEIVLDKVA
jgi:ParB/RepB/Spo0J family partition protein